MKSRMLAIIGAAFLAGVLSGWRLSAPREGRAGDLTRTAQAQEVATTSSAELAAIQSDVERLKKVVPDQSHSMSDVDYHFANLWFAGQAGNWPLAEFYWKESLSHIHWAVRIIPVRKDNAGNEIKLEDILQSIETSAQFQLGEVIKQQDQAKFESTYRTMLEACYMCHKASDKPYLRPHVPERPGSAMINFDPTATWPK